MSSRLEALKKYIANAERTFVVGGDPSFARALVVKEVLAVLAFGNLSAEFPRQVVIQSQRGTTLDQPLVRAAARPW